MLTRDLLTHHSLKCLYCSEYLVFPQCLDCWYFFELQIRLQICASFAQIPKKFCPSVFLIAAAIHRMPVDVANKDMDSHKFELKWMAHRFALCVAAGCDLSIWMDLR